MANSSSTEKRISEKKKKILNAGDMISFPESVGPHTMLITFTEYDYDLARAGSGGLSSILNPLDVRSGAQPTISTSISNLSAIQLPLPSSLNDNTNLEITNINQGALETAFGELIGRGVGAIQNSGLTLGDISEAGLDRGKSFANSNLANSNLDQLGSQFMSGVSNAVQSILNTSLGDASRDALYLLRSVLPAGVSNVVDRASGNTINPRASLMFEGVGLKQHSFSWTLAPQSQQESETLNSLINMIKINSLPIYQQFLADTTNFKAYLKYPSIAQIYLLGVNSNYFMKFKPSLVSAVNVDYASNGLVPIVKGGKPAAVNLSLEFSELDIHTAGDYSDDIQAEVLTPTTERNPEDFGP